MSVVYPYALSDLANTGRVPSNGGALVAMHFNRLFSEIAALQSALGPGDRLRGTQADFKTRLGGEMNTDGTFERELITDSDVSGNKLGSTRYFDAQKDDAQLSIPTSSIGQDHFTPLAYSAWEEPPVFFCGWADDTNLWQQYTARDLVTAVSEVGAQTTYRQHNGQPVNNTIDGEVHWIAISRSRITWDPELAWALPPVRTGS